MMKGVHATRAPVSEESYNKTHRRIDEYFQKFWRGEIKNPAPSEANGNIFEFYGLRRDPMKQAQD